MIWAILRRRRFCSSCCSSSLMFVVAGAWAWGELEVFAGQLAQDDGLDPLEIIEAVLGGGLDGLQQRLARIFLHQAEQAAQRQRGTARVVLSESLNVGGRFPALSPAAVFLPDAP